MLTPQVTPTGNPGRETLTLSLCFREPCSGPPPPWDLGNLWPGSPKPAAGPLPHARGQGVHPEAGMGGRAGPCGLGTKTEPGWEENGQGLLWASFPSIRAWRLLLTAALPRASPEPYL